MATFVLVHGAWHGGWCWREVADLLRRDGHSVYTPTLSGLADRSHLLSPDIDLETHVADVANLIAWEELSEVVLCGHSYGGMVVTGAADRGAQKIRSLVYLDAFVPDNGKSLEDYAPPHRREHMFQEAREKGDGWKVPPLPVTAWLIDQAQRDWVSPKVTPHPLACMTQRLEITDATDSIAERHYVLAAANEGSAFYGFYEQLVDNPAWICHSIAGPHDLMVAHPAETTDVLLEAAA